MKDAEGNKKIKGIYENAYKRGLNAASASSYISAKHGSFSPSLDASIKVKLSKSGFLQCKKSCSDRSFSGNYLHIQSYY